LNRGLGRDHVRGGVQEGIPTLLGLDPAVLGRRDDHDELPGAVGQGDDLGLFLGDRSGVGGNGGLLVLLAEDVDPIPDGLQIVVLVIAGIDVIPVDVLLLQLHLHVLGEGGPGVVPGAFPTGQEQLVVQEEIVDGVVLGQVGLRAEGLEEIGHHLGIDDLGERGGVLRGGVIHHLDIGLGLDFVLGHGLLPKELGQEQ
jgi:hypothetical protein